MRVLGSRSDERISGDFLIMSAMPGEAALEQDELGRAKRWGRKSSTPVKETGDFVTSAAFPAGQRDVRVKSAAFGF